MDKWWYGSKEDIGNLWEGIKEGLSPDLLEEILRNFIYTYIYTLLIAMLTSWVDRHFLSVSLTKLTEIYPTPFPARIVLS